MFEVKILETPHSWELATLLELALNEWPSWQIAGYSSSISGFQSSFSVILVRETAR